MKTLVRNISAALVLTMGMVGAANAGLLFSPSSTGSSVNHNLDQVCAIIFCSDVELNTTLASGLDSVSGTLNIGESMAFDSWSASAISMSSG